jgi:putative heme transporter
VRSRIEQLAAGLEQAAAALRTAARDGHGMTRAACFAAGYWLFDFAVLAAIALAATRGSPLAGLALAYVVGRVAAAVPITPGGVGVVETTMTAALVTQGMTAGPAAAVVLAWRLISRWLPIVVGLIVYLAAGTGSGPQPAEPNGGVVVRVGGTVTAGQRASWLTEPPASSAPCGHS